MLLGQRAGLAEICAPLVINAQKGRFLKRIWPFLDGDEVEPAGEKPLTQRLGGHLGAGEEVDQIDDLIYLGKEWATIYYYLCGWNRKLVE